MQIASGLFLCTAVLALALAGCGEVVDETPDADNSTAADAAGAADASAPADAAGADAAATPDTTVTAAPPDPDNQTSPEFAFSSDTTGATFQCRVDNGGFSPCTSPHIAAVSGEGAHTFEVYASKDGFDDPTPASHTWVLDVTPPSVSITNGPPGLTSSSTASFTFNIEAGATAECRVDGAPFGACTGTSGHTASGLGTGSHTFQVRARDAANNQQVDDYAWTIEPPCSPILIEAESLTGTGWNIASGTVLSGGQALDTSTVNNSFSFTFQGKGLVIYYRKGPGAGAHSVSIDGSSPVNISATESSWSYQNPSTVATGLTNINHTATVTCTAASCQVDYFDVTCN